MKRKLNKRQKLCRNLLLILVFALLYLLLTSFWGYLTADQAHAASEMTLNYGPSQIVQVVKDGNYRYYLGKYDRWFSCHPVYRTITGWRFGSQSLCDEIQPDKDINFSWMISSDEGRVWGVVNNFQREQSGFSPSKPAVSRHVFTFIFPRRTGGKQSGGRISGGDLRRLYFKGRSRI